MNEFWKWWRRTDDVRSIVLALVIAPVGFIRWPDGWRWVGVAGCAFVFVCAVQSIRRKRAARGAARSTRAGP